MSMRAIILTGILMACIAQLGWAKTAVPAAKKAPQPAIVFAPADLDLAPGERYMFEVTIRNPIGKPQQATVTLAPDPGLTVSPATWKGRLPTWGVKLYLRISAAPDRSADGSVTVRLAVGGKTLAQRAFVVRNTVPQADIVADWQGGAVTFRITNTFRTRKLKGGVTLTNPDRFLQDITTGLFDVEPGRTAEVRIPIPGAAPAPGESYQFTAVYRTWEGYTGRISRYLEYGG